MAVFEEVYWISQEFQVKGINSPAVQLLGLHAFTADGRGSIPVQGTKILQRAWHGQTRIEKNSKWDCMDFIDYLGGGTFFSWTRCMYRPFMRDVDRLQGQVRNEFWARSLIWEWCPRPHQSRVGGKVPWYSPSPRASGTFGSKTGRPRPYGVAT